MRLSYLPGQWPGQFLSPMNVSPLSSKRMLPQSNCGTLGAGGREKVNLLSIYMPRPKKVKRNNISVISDWIRVSGVNHGIQSEDRVRQYQTNAMMMDKPNVEEWGPCFSKPQSTDWAHPASLH